MPLNPNLSFRIMEIREKKKDNQILEKENIFFKIEINLEDRML